MSKQGGGSYGITLKLAAATNIYTGQDDTTALEGYNLAADTHTSQVIGVPFPLKGAGLVFDTGSATAGTAGPGACRLCRHHDQPDPGRAGVHVL